MILLIEGTWKVKFIDTESRIEVTRGREQGTGELLSNRDRISVWEDTKFWRGMVGRPYNVNIPTAPKPSN